MPLTIADCLRLPSLCDAKVMAGQSGLNRTVEFITVMESTKANEIACEYLRSNELAISSLIAIRDNIEEQCALLRHLNTNGEVGLIVFCVGIFVSKLDQKVLDTADELGFPIITTPTNRYDLKYSDVIFEVMEAIFNERIRHSYLVMEMLDRISNLDTGARKMGTVLQLLSDRLNCPLLLVDKMFNLIEHTNLPNHFDIGPEEIVAMCNNERSLSLLRGSMLNLDFSDKQLAVYCQPIFDERRLKLFLIAVQPEHKMTTDYFEQAAAVIRFAMSIWQQKYRYNAKEDLFYALMNGDITTSNMLAEKLDIDISSLHAMWVLIDNNNHFNATEQDVLNAQRLTITKLFLQEYKKWVLVDTYENAVVALLNTPAHSELEEGLPNILMSTLSGAAENAALVIYDRLENCSDISRAYATIKHTLGAARVVFPYQRILAQQELMFVEHCQSVIASGKEGIQAYTHKLDPLRIVEDTEHDLLTILSTMMLDAEMNTTKTANMLFLHRNTVYYHLRRMKQLLGYDLFVMPAMANIYMALAIERLVGAY